MTSVVFLLVPRLHLLDLAGPAQVFHTAAELGYPLRAALRGGAGRVAAAQGLPLRGRVTGPRLARPT